MDPREFAEMLAKTVVQQMQQQQSAAPHAQAAPKQFMYNVIRTAVDGTKREETTSLPQIMAALTDQQKLNFEQIGELVASVDALANEIKSLRRLLKKKVDDDEDDS